jgi:hypothetical protein
MVPVKEEKTATYIVQVPVKEEKTSTYTVKVPYTEQVEEMFFPNVLIPNIWRLSCSVNL